MIWLYLFLGIVCAGVKFPFDLLRGENAERYEVMNREAWGLEAHDFEVQDSLSRIRTNYNKRGLSHNLTSLPISVLRYWAKRDAQSIATGGPRYLPGIVKAMSALVVWPWIILALYKLSRLFW
jgi:hypothetical protein